MTAYDTPVWMHVGLTSVVNPTLNLKTLSQSVCLAGLIVQHPDL